MMIQPSTLTILLATFIVPASSHVGISPPGAPSGGRFTGAFRIPHGCDGASTDKVTIEIPAMPDADGKMHPLLSVKPQMPDSRWSISMEYRAVDPPVDYHGLKNETVSKIVWTLNPDAKSLPTNMFEFFGLTFKLPEVPPGKYPFNVRQDCLNSDGTGEGFLDWSDLSEDAERPPPQFIVTEPEDDGHGSHSAMTTEDKNNDPDSEDGVMDHSTMDHSNHGTIDHSNHGVTAVREEASSMMLQAETDKMNSNSSLSIAALVVGIIALIAAVASVITKRSAPSKTFKPEVQEQA